MSDLTKNISSSIYSLLKEKAEGAQIEQEYNAINLIADEFTAVEEIVEPLVLQVREVGSDEELPTMGPASGVATEIAKVKSDALDIMMDTLHDYHFAEPEDYFALRDAIHFLKSSISVRRTRMLIARADSDSFLLPSCIKQIKDLPEEDLKALVPELINTFAQIRSSISAMDVSRTIKADLFITLDGIKRACGLGSSNLDAEKGA